MKQNVNPLFMPDSHTFRQMAFNEPQGMNWVRWKTEKCAQSKY